MLSLLKKVQTGFDSPPLYSIKKKLLACEVPIQRICGTIHLRPHPTPYLCYCNQAVGLPNGAPAVFFRLRNDFSSSEFHRQVQFVYFVLSLEINLCHRRK
jgi:hypothetical protein